MSLVIKTKTKKLNLGDLLGKIRKYEAEVYKIETIGDKYTTFYVRRVEKKYKS